MMLGPNIELISPDSRKVPIAPAGLLSSQFVQVPQIYRNIANLRKNHLRRFASIVLHLNTLELGLKRLVQSTSPRPIHR